MALPTGYSRSLCYECLPFVFDEIRGLKELSFVIVVTSLVSIMKSQLSKLNESGVSAGYITSKVDKAMKHRVRQGLCRIVFFSPEMLLGHQQWRRMLLEEPYGDIIVAFVVLSHSGFNDSGCLALSIFENNSYRSF